MRNRAGAELLPRHQPLHDRRAGGIGRRQWIAGAQTHQSAPTARMDELHDDRRPARQRLRFGRPKRVGLRHVEAHGGRRQREGVLVVQAHHRFGRHGEQPHAFAKAIAHERGVHRLLGDRNDELGPLLARHAGEIVEVARPAHRRGRHLPRQRHRARRPGEVAPERLGHHHPPAVGGERACEIQRLRQPAQRQHHGPHRRPPQRPRRATAHITCDTGRVVSRAAGRTSPGRSMRKSKSRNSRAISSTASTCANAAPAHTRGPVPKGM